jgi:hypothetical protein
VTSVLDVCFEMNIGKGCGELPTRWVVQEPYGGTNASGCGFVPESSCGAHNAHSPKQRGRGRGAVPVMAAAHATGAPVDDSEVCFEQQHGSLTESSVRDNHANPEWTPSGVAQVPGDNCWFVSERYALLLGYPLRSRRKTLLSHVP